MNHLLLLLVIIISDKPGRADAWQMPHLSLLKTTYINCMDRHQTDLGWYTMRGKKLHLLTRNLGINNNAVK